MLDRMLPTLEAAEYLGLHPETLRKMARLRQIAHVQHKQHGRMRFRLSDLNNWLAKGYVPERRR